MSRVAVFLLLVSLIFCSEESLAAAGSVYKCRGSDGKLQFSDVPCKTGDSELVKNQWGSVSRREQLDAESRSNRMQADMSAIERERVNARRSGAIGSGRDANVTPPATRTQSEIAACIRNVEESGLSGKAKAIQTRACQDG